MVTNSTEYMREGAIAKNKGLSWIMNPYYQVFFNTQNNRLRMAWWHLGWKSHDKETDHGN